MGESLSNGASDSSLTMRSPGDIPGALFTCFIRTFLRMPLPSKGRPEYVKKSSMVVVVRLSTERTEMVTFVVVSIDKSTVWVQARSIRFGTPYRNMCKIYV